jgi:DNA-binding winged helix-turn-helix (wHTH) protein
VIQRLLMRYRFGQIELDEDRFLLLREGERLRLRPKVFDLLAYLVRYRDRVVRRDELVLALWGRTAVGLGSLSGLVNELRQVLGESGRGRSSIRTVHARGYQFVAPISRCDAAGPASHDAPLDSSPNAVREVGSSARATQAIRLGGAVRSAIARVESEGARAVLVSGGRAAERSAVLEEACAEIERAGFQMHRLRLASADDARSTYLVDRVLDALIECHGIEALRSVTPERARAVLERSSTKQGGARVGAPAGAPGGGPPPGPRGPGPAPL